MGLISRLPTTGGDDISLPQKPLILLMNLRCLVFRWKKETNSMYSPFLGFFIFVHWWTQKQHLILLMSFPCFVFLLKKTGTFWKYSPFLRFFICPLVDSKTTSHSFDDLSLLCFSAEKKETFWMFSPSLGFFICPLVDSKTTPHSFDELSLQCFSVEKKKHVEHNTSFGAFLIFVVQTSSSVDEIWKSVGLKLMASRKAFCHCWVQFLVPGTLKIFQS